MNETTSRHAVVLQRVTRRYGQKLAVNELSFSVPLGAICGLIGPNGAGKTTTFSMLAGFLLPSEGELRVLDFAPHDTDALRGRRGVLPQDAVLPPLETVGQFLTTMARLQGLSGDAVQAEVQRVLHEVEGESWQHSKCSALSHGMAKRVALAQALLGAPELVLLDEPTAGLDPRVAYEVRQLIAKLKGKATVIVSSHNLSELEQVCDHAVIIDRGQLVRGGTMADLTASSEQFQVLLAAPIADEVLEHLRGQVGLSEVSWNAETRTLHVRFDTQRGEAEEAIGLTLGVLLHANARISGVSKGHGLEQRVMALT